MSSPTIEPTPISHLKAVPSGSATARVETPDVFSGKRAATRHRLMDACGTIIIRDGFEAVSMTSVAEEAGITRQTVYRYFPNAREVVRTTLMGADANCSKGNCSSSPKRATRESCWWRRSWRRFG